MKIRTALLLIPVLLALSAGSAAAKQSPQRSGVDPGFGHGGTIAVSVPKGSVEGIPLQMAIAPSGKSYVLARSLLLAFGADGRPDTGFAPNGRLKVAAATGETTEVTGLAVDSQGRVLVSGSVNPTPGVPDSAVPPDLHPYLSDARSNAFVIRYLPDGERDPTFGVGGQIEVTLTPPDRPTLVPNEGHLESPVVLGDQLAVVDGEQPVLGGAFSYNVDVCYGGGIRRYGFVAPIDATAGSTVENLPLGGYTELPLPEVARLVPLPAGNLAAISTERSPCGHGGLTYPLALSTLDYGSARPPALDPLPSLSSLTFGSSGQIYTIERTESVRNNVELLSPPKVLRLQPDGDLDTGFGTDGGVPLKKFGEERVGGMVLDGRQRPIVGGGDTKFRLVRLGTKGKIDQSFGNHGWVEVGFGRGSEATVEAMSTDPKGRIIAAGRVASSALKTGEGIGLTRILPGS